jgi:hypothetical protein
MELSLADRLKLIQILPEQGNAATLRVVLDFQTALAPSDQELTEWEIRNEKLPDGRDVTAWNNEKAKAKEIEITPARLNLIKDGLKKLDDSKSMALSMLPLYEKFSAMTVEEVVK